MAKHDLLFELGCEELPAKGLSKMAESLANNIAEGCKAAQLSFRECQWFATPRRLAVLVSDVADKQADIKIQRRGPAKAQAYDQAGQPTKALLGFAKSVGVTVDKLQEIKTEKGIWLGFDGVQKGQSAEQLVPGIISKAFSQLPTGRVMRWGNHEAAFVRPVHWLVVMLGRKVVPMSLLGIDASNVTYGHRFHAPEPINIKRPLEYESLLYKQGKVVAHFGKRRGWIVDQIKQLLSGTETHALIDDVLLDEVTGLVEWPVAMVGQFDDAFLSVPKEALMSAMQSHQKCFAVVDATEKLVSQFILVSNIQSRDPKQVVAGNQRVMTARLSDAQFFYETDLKTPLAERVTQLDAIAFHVKLGSLGDKTRRIENLAKFIAEQIGVDTALSARAATLCKADLVTDMVGEFPELQGIMGEYYARYAGEDLQVARALREHYQPQFSQDNVPQTPLGQIIALADKLDTVVGLFGINEPPTGTKDPFALRRAMLGLLRILWTYDLPLSLSTCIKKACAGYGDQLINKEVETDVLNYAYERLRYWSVENGVEYSHYAAVKASSPSTLVDFKSRLAAMSSFTQHSEAAVLCEANKRINNILRKQDVSKLTRVKSELLIDHAEKNLYSTLKTVFAQVEPLLKVQDYAGFLNALIPLCEPVDQFFEQVMVLCEDDKVRNNRLSLLVQLQVLFSQVADLSVLTVTSKDDVMCD